MQQPHQVPLAGIAALAQGDLENFLVAATPGGIQAQESRGQQALVAQCLFPVRIAQRGITHEMLTAKWGITFEPGIVDGLFYKANLPPGWSIRPTEHSMNSDLVDSQACNRAGIFYKAAFYDRNADVTLTMRYGVSAQYEGADFETGTLCERVVDSKTAAVLFESKFVPRKDFKAQDVIRTEAEAFLLERFPDYRDPFAYWAD